jgi:hypothetical protein
MSTNPRKWINLCIRSNKRIWFAQDHTISKNENNTVTLTLITRKSRDKNKKCHFFRLINADDKLSKYFIAFETVVMSCVKITTMYNVEM